jgi:GntP family gluconate:H+ symporter
MDGRSTTRRREFLMYLLLLLLGAIAFIVIAIVRLKLHPFLALLLTAIGFGLLAGMPGADIIAAITQGFGNTLGAVGPLIVVGVMIGALLEASGGAFALAQRVLSWIGEKRVTWGMALMGFITSIPVFGDSTFIILQSLNRALTKRAGLSLAVTATALAAGLSASHCLVPPTPGPIAAAELVGADLGLVIGWGVTIGLLSVVPAVLWAQWMGSRIWIDPAPDMDEAAIQEATANAPGAFKSALPIFVPLVLIVLKSFNDNLGVITEGPAHSVISFIGTPIIAL